MFTDYDLPIKLPAKYYPAIGELLYRWALLEFQMQVIIWRTLNIDNKKGRTLTVGMSARALMAILRTMSLRWAGNKTDIQMLNSIAKHAGKLINVRNSVAHGTWMYPSGGRKTAIRLHFMKETPEHRLLPRTKKYTPDKIKTDVGKLARINERAEALITMIEARQPPST